MSHKRPPTAGSKRYYPEKRPFFIENSDFFTTPIDLVFTRRIADPDFGARLTGKSGPYSIGMLVADDRSPGRELPDNDPLSASRAYYSILRVRRDIWKQSTIGMIYTDREYHGAFNRVGGIDGRFKLDAHWVLNLQAVTSSTGFDDKTTQGGPAFYAKISRSGRNFNYTGNYNDASAGYLTYTGFFLRPDYRETWHNLKYTFHPAHSVLLSHGPMFGFSRAFDHRGVSLNSSQSAQYIWQFKGQNHVEVGGQFGTEGLRPSDFASLANNKQYATSDTYFYYSSNYFTKVGFHVMASHDNLPSYITSGIYDAPPIGQAPRRVHEDQLDFGATIKPVSRAADRRQISSR